MKTNISILVADDEAVLRDVLIRILTKEGYTVETASDGEEALAKLRSKEFQLLICDVKMPRLNGFELLKAAKREFPDLGVIMMTAYGDSFTVKDALLAGADEYITKPFKPFEINLIVERAYFRLVSAGKPTT